MPVGNQGTDPTEDVNNEIAKAFEMFTDYISSDPKAPMTLGREDGVFYAEFMGEKNKVMRRNILIVAGNKYSTGEVRK